MRPRRHPVFRGIWFLTNLLLLTTLVLAGYGSVWEFATRKYLKGFTDAVVPLTEPPEHKVEAILTWMREGPARRESHETEGFLARDPQNTLEYQRLLQVCGTATNAFVNLASSSGLEARRLLLLDSSGITKHVVAEVRLAGRWIVVDPAYRFMFRDAQGRFMTREQLLDARLLREATARIPDYPPSYTFENAAQVRLARLGFAGVLLRTLLDALTPNWQESAAWTRLTERASMALTVAAVSLFLFLLAGGGFLSWYGKRRLGIERLRLLEQLLRAGQTLFSNPR